MMDDKFGIASSSSASVFGTVQKLPWMEKTLQIAKKTLKMKKMFLVIQKKQGYYEVFPPLSVQRKPVFLMHGY